MSNYYLGTMTAVCGMGIMNETGGGSAPPAPPTYGFTVQTGSTGSTVESDALITCQAVITVTGTTQTNGFVVIRFGYENGAEANIKVDTDSPVVTNDAGWTATFSFAPGSPEPGTHAQYLLNIGAAVVAVGVYTVEFTIRVQKGVHTSFNLFESSAMTDQAADDVYGSTTVTFL